MFVYYLTKLRAITRRNYEPSVPAFWRNPISQNLFAAVAMLSKILQHMATSKRNVATYDRALSATWHFSLQGDLDL